MKHTASVSSDRISMAIAWASLFTTSTENSTSTILLKNSTTSMLVCALAKKSSLSGSALK
jgi:hypothetical protein